MLEGLVVSFHPPTSKTVSTVGFQYLGVLCLGTKLLALSVQSQSEQVSALLEQLGALVFTRLRAFCLFWEEGKVGSSGYLYVTALRWIWVQI